MKESPTIKMSLKKTSSVMHLFTTTHFHWFQFLVILLIGMSFIFMPQKPQGNDWELNTRGYWADIPQTYLNNRNFVYPPWGLLLLLPYYLIRSEGVRLLTVLTLGWLCYKYKWPLTTFLIIVFSPYFLLAMAISNMDILITMLPMLLWDAFSKTHLRNAVRGICFALMLLKPQCTVFLIIYLIWIDRKDTINLIVQLAITAMLVLPISLVGSPPLIIQWVENLAHPSTPNQIYWAGNNISLTARLGVFLGAGVFLFAGGIFWHLARRGGIKFRHEQTISSLILSSMFLLPYASLQSFISGLAWIPSWLGFFVQWTHFLLGLGLSRFYSDLHWFSFSTAFFTLLIYSLQNERRKNLGGIP